VTVRDGLHEFQDEVDVLKNQLSAAAHEEVSVKNELVHSIQMLEDRKTREGEMAKKLHGTQRRYEDEMRACKTAEEKADMADKYYQETESKLRDMHKTMKSVKEELYKQSQDLYRLRQEEATTLGEISGAQSAIKNLQHQIQRLDIERQRQQELLYAVDFQSQSMQRKVARVSGERTLEEKEELIKKTEQCETELEEKMTLWNILTAQHKKQDAELRQAQRTLVKVKEEESKTKEEMNELQLQNEILQRMMNQSTREKEEVLVHHDVMKLEVSRLRNKLTNRTEQVFALENRKQQLSLSMQEREKEVEVHLDVLRAQTRVAQDERHKTAIELAERKQKIYSLKMKYEATVAKTKKTDDPEYSQAYYVLQAAQAKEELQRNGDELDAKIRKAEREIRALENTLAHLLTRNQKYKENFKKVDKHQEQQVLEKQQLDEQSRAANETLFKKKQQLAQVDKELEEDGRRLAEMQRQQQSLMENRLLAVETRQAADRAIVDLDLQLNRAREDREQRAAQARASGALADPPQGFSKSLVEVDLDVRAVREHTSIFLHSLQRALASHPRASEMLRSVCEAKGLSLEPPALAADVEAY